MHFTLTINALESAQYTDKPDKRHILCLKYCDVGYFEEGVFLTIVTSSSDLHFESREDSFEYN